MLQSRYVVLLDWWKNDANKLAIAGSLAVIVLLLAMTVVNSQRFSKGMEKVHATQSELPH